MGVLCDSLGMRLLLFAGLLVSLCAPASAAAAVVSPAKASLGGKPLSSGALRLSSARAAYLRFHVPSSWRYFSPQLVLSPASGSRGVSARVVSVAWRGGVASSLADPGRSVFSGALSAGVAERLDLVSLLPAGSTLTLQLRSRSGSVRLSRVPYLRRVDQPYQLAAVGDIACPTTSSQWNGGQGTASRCGGARVAELVSPDDRQLLLLGDLQYSSGELSQFQSAFGAAFAGFAARMRPVPGNHEYQSGSADGFFTYMSSMGVSTGSDGVYAFDAGAWRVIALNSNDGCVYLACEAGSRQEQFLRVQLAAAREAGRCTLAFWHHPRASGGSHGDNGEVADLWRAMYELGGDVVLSGHDHDYERFGPLDAEANPAGSGPVQFVVGTGGYSFYPVTPRAGSVKAITDVFGLLRLRLYRSSYGFEWVGESGRGSDAGSADCF